MLKKGKYMFLLPTFKYIITFVLICVSICISVIAFCDNRATVKTRTITGLGVIFACLYVQALAALNMLASDSVWKITYPCWMASGFIALILGVLGLIFSSKEHARTSTIINIATLAYIAIYFALYMLRLI